MGAVPRQLARVERRDPTPRALVGEAEVSRGWERHREGMAERTRAMGSSPHALVPRAEKQAAVFEAIAVGSLIVVLPRGAPVVDDWRKQGEGEGEG